MSEVQRVVRKVGWSVRVPGRLVIRSNKAGPGPGHRKKRLKLEPVMRLEYADRGSKLELRWPSSLYSEHDLQFETPEELVDFAVAVGKIAEGMAADLGMPEPVEQFSQRLAESPTATAT